MFNTLEPTNQDTSFEPFVRIANETCADLVEKGLIFFTLDPITRAPVPQTNETVQTIIIDSVKAIHDGLIRHINDHLPPSTPGNNDSIITSPQQDTDPTMF